MFGGPCDPEVDHARPVGSQQHVRRLQVSVYHPSRVDCLERLGEAQTQPEHRRQRQRPARRHGVRQRWPGDVLDGQPRPLGGSIGVHHRRRVDAPHGPGGRHLVREPRPECRVGRKPRVDDLDRHRPAARGAAEIHPAHAALAQQAQHLEPAELARIGVGQGPQPPFRHSLVPRIRQTYPRIARRRHMAPPPHVRLLPV